MFMLGTQYQVTCAAAMPLLATISVLLLALMLWDRPVSFDGAWNLQVAQNLAHGEGYSRFYSGLRYFPHEVETNVPFTVPAALIFSIFGVSLLTAQLTNLTYIIFFSVALFLLLRSHLGSNWACLAVLGMVTTPGIVEYGADGYGELPALTWWLVGTALVLSSTRNSITLFLGGICLGLAV